MTLRKFLTSFWTLHVAGMIAFLAVALTATFWWLDAYTRHGQEVKVPNVCGLTSTQAIKALLDAGLQAEIADTGYVHASAPGIILAQSVAGGTSLKEGRLINLTVNSPHAPFVTLPDLADNSSLREAEQRIRAIGLKLEATEYIDGEKDWVYDVKVNGQSRPAGSRISGEARVTLVAGNGADLDGMEENDSTENLYWEMDDEAVGMP